MADQKPEVNLEIASGFFRIPTESVIYNLTVLGGDSGRLPVVERIVEQERRQEEKERSKGGEAVLQRLTEELASLARALLADDTAARLARCREELAAILADLATDSAAGPPGAALDEGHLQKLTERVQELMGLVAENGQAGGDLPSPAEAAPEPQAAAVEERYAFDLDVVFQTLYELCTNEQVKTHISTARQNRDEYFDREVFLQEINKVVANLEPDADNFFNVPMSDLLAALRAGCREKPIRNLLKKMDANQAAIFLDQFLPLEVPPKETVEVEEATPPAESGPSSPPPEASAAAGKEDLAVRLRPLLEALQADLGALAAMAGSGSTAGAGGFDAAVERLRQLDAQLAGLATSLAEDTGRQLAELALALSETVQQAGEGGALDTAFISALTAAKKQVQAAGPADVVGLLAKCGGG